ncbi:MAG: alpha/beta hydrolase [Candidatus Cloacimonetes bacterium]|nr:alpha/beta hydrolase [Candidatus Cloacimonadota bacterium]
MELIPHEIKVLDTRIHYYTCGAPADSVPFSEARTPRAGKGSSLLFVHGHRADALRYKGVITYLAQFFQVYAPDLPGFGKSPPLAIPHTMENLAKYLAAFAERLTLKNFTLAGFSMGSIIAIHTALLIEPKLCQIILLGTPFDKNFLKMTTRKRKAMSKFFTLAAKNKTILFIADKIQKNNKIMKSLVKRQLPKDKQTKEIINYEVHFWQIMPMKVWFEASADLLQSSSASKNFKIMTPTLLIETPHDHLLQVEKNLAALKKSFPNHKVIMFSLDRHVPYGDFNEDFVKSLASNFEKYLFVCLRQG